ncbi:hypothetical protein K438DRAFT_1777480 [Mycena galopus ATCC 62051]|nr:hypothetical protein K438DRAFT_1777480 [Mycena galopus ATCC 62051]
MAKKSPSKVAVRRSPQKHGKNVKVKAEEPLARIDWDADESAATYKLITQIYACNESQRSGEASQRQGGEVTGGGLQNNSDDEGRDVHEFLECYISSEGPDHDTTPQAKNLWGLYLNTTLIFASHLLVGWATTLTVFPFENGPNVTEFCFSRQHTTI